MTGEIIAIIGVGVALAVLVWRSNSRLEGRIDKLQESHQSLAREFSELKGALKAKGVA